MNHQFAREGSALETKLQLYAAATYLFERGLSHPQIVEMLSKHHSDKELLTLITDKAMRDEWDQLHEYSRQLFEEGKSYDEVVRLMTEKEKDREVVDFLCNKWYEWKSEWMEHALEAPSNIQQGLLWVVICSIMVVVVFVYDWFTVSKILWILALVVSALQFFFGIIQKRYAKNIEKILRTKIR